MNIKSFIMSLGKDFSFIGNQHRLIVSERECFIDFLLKITNNAYQWLTNIWYKFDTNERA